MDMADLPHDPSETARLLERARHGDQQAFDQLLSKHREQLRQFIELRLDRRLRPRVDASDVVQETLLVAFRRLGDYLDRKPMAFRLWLRRTAWERLADLRGKHLATGRRSAAREATFPDGSSAVLARQLAASGPSPSEQCSERERQELVAGAVARLPQEDREILLMRTHEQLCYEDIGHILGIRPAAARKRYGRALVRLQRVLRDSGVGGSTR
jgi:RNA polymerase sigma-70 factor (ECF subfamily)